MGLLPYYGRAACNRNVGRIKAIYETPGKSCPDMIVNINAGHGGGNMTLPTSCCRGFHPQVDDRVFICVDDRDGTIALIKMKKTRQDRKKV